MDGNDGADGTPGGPPGNNSKSAFFEQLSRNSRFDNGKRRRADLDLEAWPKCFLIANNCTNYMELLS